MASLEIYNLQARNSKIYIVHNLEGRNSKIYIVHNLEGRAPPKRFTPDGRQRRSRAVVRVLTCQSDVTVVLYLIDILLIVDLIDVLFCTVLVCGPIIRCEIDQVNG